jgi:ketosteroid isomerase-like protein
MSQENVEIVRAAYKAVMLGDWDLADQTLNPAVEFHGTVGGIWEGNIMRGPQEIRQAIHEEDLEAWDERRFEPQQFIDAGDRIVVLQHEFRRGKGSGIEVENDTAVTFEVRNGRVIRIRAYMDRAEALEAAGLSE